jgi:hypothetical protein
MTGDQFFLGAATRENDEALTLTMICLRRGRGLAVDLRVQLWPTDVCVVELARVDLVDVTDRRQRVDRLREQALIAVCNTKHRVNECPQGKLTMQIQFS